MNGENLNPTPTTPDDNSQSAWDELAKLDQQPPKALPDDIFSDDPTPAPESSPNSDLAATTTPEPLPSDVLQGEPTHGSLPDDIFPDDIFPDEPTPEPLPNNVVQDVTDLEAQGSSYPNNLNDPTAPPSLPDDIFE